MPAPAIISNALIAGAGTLITTRCPVDIFRPADCIVIYGDVVVIGVLDGFKTIKIFASRYLYGLGQNVFPDVRSVLPGSRFFEFGVV